MKSEIEELEHKASEQGFWGDMENSRRVLQGLSTLKLLIGSFDALYKKWQDIDILNQLGIEENDESIVSEVKFAIDEYKRDFKVLKLKTLLTGPYDKKNAILTLHAGAGGTEAQDWVEMLLTIMITGEHAYGYLRCEKGVHRLVRISPFDSSGRRHTSFASLDVMPEIDDDIEININPDDLRVDTYRSSGAGGQHVNKTDSAVRITHVPTGVVVQCQSERSQHQNKDTAMKMLKAKLFELKEREHLEKIEDLKGVQMEIAWGSQIRSYVFCPYTLVKDHRTNYEEGNVQAVMDGEIDSFINAYLAGSKNGNI